MFHFLLYFLLFSVFSFLSFFITYLVIPYGRTDGRRGLSKLLLHGTRENRNTPENSPPSPFLAFYELAVDSREKSLHCLISRLLRRLKFFYLQVEFWISQRNRKFLKCLDKILNNPIYKTFRLSKVQLELTEKWNFVCVLSLYLYIFKIYI